MFEYDSLLQAFLLDEVKPVNLAVEYGITSLDMPTAAGDYWRVLGVYKLSGNENKYGHYIYVDVVDENGERMEGERVTLHSGGMVRTIGVTTDGDNEPGVKFEMRRGMVYHVSMFNSPTETWTGFNVDYDDVGDDELGNSSGHHSFYAVFQRWNKENDNTGPGPVEPLVDAIIREASSMIIELDKDAEFYKVAQANNLGERLSVEFEMTHDLSRYRVQVYERGYVWAEVGKDNQINIIDR